MGEIVKGWRRKVGLLTLLMALIFMGGWFRSLTVVDHWCHSDGQSFYVLGASGEGLIALGHNRHVTNHKWKFFEGYVNGYTQLTSSQVRDDLRFSPNAGWEANVRCELFGIKLTNAKNKSPWNEVETAVLHVPYWFIVIPLTTIASWLLLAKPRVWTPKNTSQSVPNEGAAV